MPSYMWRKDLMDNIGFFNENIQGCEDYDFVIRTFILLSSKYYTFCHISEYLFIYNQRFDTLSTKLENEIPILKKNVINKFKQYKLLTSLSDDILASSECFIYISNKKFDKFTGRAQQITKRMGNNFTKIFVSNEHNELINKIDDVIIVNNKLFDLYISNFTISQVTLMSDSIDNLIYHNKLDRF